MWHCIKLVVLKLEFRSDIDVGSLVFCGVAILGRREDYGQISVCQYLNPELHTCDAFTVMLHLITLHSHLVRSNDSFEAIVIAEVLGHIRTEL